MKIILFIQIAFALHRVDQQVSLVTKSSTDNRLPFPKNLDWDRLYCFGDAIPIAPIAAAARLAINASSFVEVKCMQDSNCEGFTPFCVAGICRECRQTADCPVGNAASIFCSLESEYTCSACLVDADCGAADRMCRFVEDLNVVRKRCVPLCEAPPKAIMASGTTCIWTCPAGQAVGMDGKCESCPVCAANEMLVPGNEFSLSQPNSFFPTCAQSTDPKCMLCPGADTRCAVVDPLGLGRLPPQYPCGSFTCKPDWYLDSSIGQCRQCDYRACPYGHYLLDCGLGNPGTCAPCQANAVSTDFMQPQDKRYSVSKATDVCKPVCPNPGQRLFRAYPNYPWTCIDCTGASCPLGSFYAGCGPDETDGACEKCTMLPPPGSAWSPAGGCRIQACVPGICVPGTYLVGCGGGQTGGCQACPASLPEHAERYISELDSVTMSANTCAFQCSEGFYRTAATCTQCSPSRCASGKRLVDCGGTDPGICVDCAPIGEGNYFLASSTICQSARCTGCGVGQWRSGCGGSSAGTCVSCGTLPVGTAEWTEVSDIQSCGVRCKSDYYMSPIIPTLKTPTLAVTVTSSLLETAVVTPTITRTCTACASYASQCAVGQYLTGCGPTSPGACVGCDPIPNGTYWTGGLVAGPAGSLGGVSTPPASPTTTCSTSLCSARNCGPAAYAAGCGQTDPGTCVSCGTVPMNGVEWKVVANQCVLQCMSGFYANNAICEICNPSACATGKYLVGCSGTAAGNCTPCSPLSDNSVCYVNRGAEMDNPDSCPSAPCPLSV